MAKGKYQEWLTKEGLIKVEGWARDGLTDEQIAKNMGINVATLYRWKDKYCDICEVLKRGKEVIDRQVENALLKRALGYKYEETTYEAIKIGDGEPTPAVKIKTVVKEVQPDTTAQIFWLKNRKPTEWRDKQQIEHTGEVTQNINNKHDLSKLSVEELKQLETIVSKSTTNTE